MFIQRNITPILHKLCGHFPVVALTGGRQTGKTTLMKSEFNNLTYVSLDLPSLAEQAEHSPEAFLTEFSPPVIIDEVQYAPSLFRHIKHKVDNDRLQMGQFLLTGSQKFSLMKEVGDSLAGRIGLLELETLSLAEIQTVAANKTFVDIICRGQFPELWRQQALPAEHYYASYLASYLERDVRQILNVTSLRDFERFIRILAARSAQLLNKSEIARDVGVSVKAIGDWLSVLEASNQIVLLEPYFQNIAKRIIKSPKIYFADTGLLCFLLKINEKNLVGSPFLGAVWETFVFSEIRKQNRLGGDTYNIFYYRDQRAREIDFFLEQAGNTMLVECKWAEKVGRKEAANIRQLSREINESGLPLENTQNYIICNTPHAYPVSGEVQALRLEQWLQKVF